MTQRGYYVTSFRVCTPKLLEFVNMVIARVRFIAKCYIKFENCCSNPKVCSRFCYTKALKLIYSVLHCKNDTLTLGIATQVQRCLAIFATLRKDQN